MSEHPPPAPDWILGDDGHWKPPPFTVGGRAAAPPAPIPTMAPPPPPPPGGWGPPPPGGAPGWVPPPSSGPSAGRIVGMVVGGFAVVGIAVVGILITAVTFLGTSAEPRFTPVGSSLPDDGRGTFTPVGEEIDPPPDQVGLLGAEEVAVALAETLTTGDWEVTGGEAIALDQVGTCAPEGWLTGAIDRFRTYYGRPSNGSTSALTLSLTSYPARDVVTGDLLRIGSQEYQDCEVEQHLEEFPTATGATVTRLPDDPRAPGVVYQVDEVGPVARTEYDVTVVVGAIRAHLDFCGCSDLGLDGQREVARQVAATMAEVQGLPVPG